MGEPSRSKPTPSAKTGKKDIVPVPAAVHIPLKSGGE